ncbi:S-adenosylmethionine decarboxylase proenzyme [subsurface metagenome]
MPKEEIKKYPLKRPLTVKQLLVDLYKCKADINDETALLTLVSEAAKKAGAHVLQASVHRFSPLGCSVVVILKETHISIHTWPEFGFAALDIFLCGESLDPFIAWEHIKEYLQPESFELKELPREIK